MGTVIPLSALQQVRMSAQPYPTHLLDGCETALALFGAGFMGMNDCIHFLDHGLQTTVVDRDGDRIAEMSELYPSDWIFAVSDAWEFAETHEEICDVVSVDTFTGDAEKRSLQSLPLWTSLAWRLVTATVALSNTDCYKAPQGWRSSLWKRNDYVYWLILERA